MICDSVCKGEPNVEGANINVSTKVWLVGETVNATCLPGLYLIPNASQSQLVECLMEGWQNVTACEAGEETTLICISLMSYMLSICTFLYA